MPFNILDKIEDRLNAILERCKCSNTGEDIAPGLTGFQASSQKANPCSILDIEVPKDTTYYHNGENEYPDVGDTVFTDPQGTIPLVTSDLPAFPTAPAFQGDAAHTAEPAGMPTDENGVVLSFTCR